MFDPLDKRFFGRNNHWSPVVTNLTPDSIDLMRLSGIRWIVSANQTMPAATLPYLKALGQCDSGPSYADYPPEEADGPVYLYELKNPQGIAFLVPRFDVLPNQDAFTNLFFDKDAPFRKKTVYLDQEPKVGDGIEKTAPVAGGDFAKLTELTSAHMKLDVTTQTPQILTMSFAWYPGWKATVDGKKAPIYRAYGGFMAIALPAGHHEVTLRYCSWTVPVSLAVVILTLLGLIAWTRKQQTVH